MLMRSKVIIKVKGHLRYAENVKMASFEELKFDWNQTLVY